jgi:hypothetical protein
MENAACVVNIGPRGIRKRMRFGVVALSLCVAAGIGMIVLGVSRPWRLLLFLPLASAASGIFQARAKT